MLVVTRDAIRAAPLDIGFTLSPIMSLTVLDVITMKHVLVLAHSGYMLLMLFKSAASRVMFSVVPLAEDCAPPVRVNDDALLCCCCNEIVAALSELALTVSLNVSISKPAFMSRTN